MFDVNHDASLLAAALRVRAAEPRETQSVFGSHDSRGDGEPLELGGCARVDADVVRSLYDDDNARVETRSPVLDVARRHATTEVRAAAARGQDAEETVDSLERLIVAVTATLRARNASERDEA